MLRLTCFHAEGANGSLLDLWQHPASPTGVPYKDNWREPDGEVKGSACYSSDDRGASGYNIGEWWGVYFIYDYILYDSGGPDAGDARG